MCGRRTIHGLSVIALLSTACGGPRAKASESAPLRTLEEPAEIRGRDGGYSALLWRASVWTFGDTVLEVEDVDGEKWHHNSWARTNDLDASDGPQELSSPRDEAGAPAYLIPPTADEREFNELHRGDDCDIEPCHARYAVWPGQPVFDPDRDRALVPFELIYGEPGAWNFHGVGAGWAVWHAPDELPQRPIVDEGQEHPTVSFLPEQPAPTLGPQIVGDALFAFACPQEGFSRRCHLGRVAIEELHDPTAWRYWDGGRWNEEQDEAAALFDGAPIMSVSFNAYLEAWMVVCAAPFDDRVVMRTAQELTGPGRNRRPCTSRTSRRTTVIRTTLCTTPSSRRRAAAFSTSPTRGRQASGSSRSSFW